MGRSRHQYHRQSLASPSRKTIETQKKLQLLHLGFLNGIVVDTDGVLPNLASAQTTGPMPKVISGRYAKQISWAIDYIQSNVDLNTETVAFLKPEGGGWFGTIKSELNNADIEFVDMQRNPDWPEGDINVAISTFHSAKGLEYDHVIILGFNQENTRFGDEEETDQIQVLRRLLAVAVARSKKTSNRWIQAGRGVTINRLF